MSFLFSNLSPLRTNFRTYPEVFKKFLAVSDKVRIASGYISADSLVDLKNIIEVNGGPYLELCAGMHFFEGMSAPQISAIKDLNSFLIEKKLGGVYIVTTFPFHGKLVSFSKQERIFGAIIGSSNLTNIVQGQRQYEADFLFEENVGQSQEVENFIDRLISISAVPLADADIKIVDPENDLLKDQIEVSKIPQSDLERMGAMLSDISFNLPLKGDQSQKSGLNASFGKGRENPQGFVIPRSWYEVEVIVPKTITQLPNYPSGKYGAFDVITDDGWKFRCRVGGDFNKNFRSEHDLKVLGKWIKGRLENAGVLKPGEIVTDTILENYGRSDIKLTKMKESDAWFLDFQAK